MIRRLASALLPLLWACGGSDPVPLSADKAPLHLEEHLKAARIEGSEVPKDLPEAVAWDFGKPQPEWKVVAPLIPGVAPAGVEQAEGALRIGLTEANRQRRSLRGGVYVDVPGWNREDWAFLLVRARSSGGVRNLTIAYNLRQQHGDFMYEYEPFLHLGDTATLINDGAVHDYLLRADWLESGSMEEPLRQLGLMAGASGPGRVEILSVSLVPKEARYAEQPAGLITEPRDSLYRRALYTHAPGKVSWRVKVPRDGRLDFGLGVLREDAPVTFRVQADGKAVFEESYARKGTWGQRSVDLAGWTGKEVDLTLETLGKKGSVALWSSPTVSGATVASGPPNVLLYVIDAGGAEYMSAYGYNRRTTPNLERLAAEGALFERAYSNSSWSKPSTTSFMTGLQHTVLGGYRLPNDPLPDRAATMAELLHGAGYQTGVFTSNSWCGVMSSLDRGVDNLIESIPGPNSASAEGLQRAFWQWREAYPGRPWWAHFQVTDVHWPWEPVPPVAGTFLSRAEREAFNDMERRLGTATGTMGRSWGLRAAAAAFEKAGIERKAYFDGVRGAFDEAMAFSDHQLGLLVERLKATGEWENTILIVTADHGDWPGLGYFDAWAPTERVAYLNPYLTRVPLVVTWPAKIEPGQRFRDPVSLLDLLPTVLDLAGRPKPDYLQGQSLAPLLLGQPGWEPRPVVIDELTYDSASGEPTGIMEIVDGRWGASLAISKEGNDLLLYDLWNDPYCLKSLHKEKPELAKKYTGLLQRKFREHQALAKEFPRGKGGAMDSEQLKTLQSLGYI
jgi:arylsulfatase A-like enzyme